MRQKNRDTITVARLSQGGIAKDTAKHMLKSGIATNRILQFSNFKSRIKPQQRYTKLLYHT